MGKAKEIFALAKAEVSLNVDFLFTQCLVLFNQAAWKKMVNLTWPDAAAPSAPGVWVFSG